VSAVSRQFYRSIVKEIDQKKDLAIKADTHSDRRFMGIWAVVLWTDACAIVDAEAGRVVSNVPRGSARRAASWPA
jgi:hypothetical protein